MRVLAESRVTRHTNLLVNISCPTPIRAAEDFNVCLHICSPLLYPGCSNNELLFKQKDNTKASHWPTKVLFSRRKHLSCYYGKCNFSKIFMKSQQTHKVSLHSQVAAGLFPYPRPALFIYKLCWDTF